MVDEVDSIVIAAAQAARAAAGSIAAASPQTVDATLRAVADRLGAEAGAVLAANQADLTAAAQAGMPAAMQDRLRLDPARLGAMAEQLRVLAAAPHPSRRRFVRELPGGLRVEERLRPVGVIGVNFEARPNVVVDVASQLLKSGNAGVLRTGSAALASAAALLDSVIAPALAGTGLHPDAIQLVRAAGHESARALVRQPRLIPLVIIRGSGETTRLLAGEAAAHGVRTLAHADGGGVLYLDRAADPDLVHRIITDSLDRLGVCNRLNLLLIQQEARDALLPPTLTLLDKLGIAAALPPHAHERGHEWAMDTGHEATVTIDFVAGPAEAARVADQETSGLAASILTEDPAAAAEFLDAYTGTGAFWNAPTRLLDGFKLLGLPETGINVDRVPGPRGPVTFGDLVLRQFVTTPAPPAG
ncbi:MAG TPA: aldehyde dehydrogenase family protein [Mycobacteriales bacterium]|nr:aldehyde dehydrogenase family protein [Mycobacteriales bacterium]